MLFSRQILLTITAIIVLNELEVIKKFCGRWWISIWGSYSGGH